MKNFFFFVFLLPLASCDFSCQPRPPKAIPLSKQFELIDSRRANPHIKIMQEFPKKIVFEGTLKDTIDVIIQMTNDYLGFNAQIIYKKHGICIDMSTTKTLNHNLTLTDYFYDYIGDWKGYVFKNMDGNYEFSGIWKSHQKEGEYGKFKLIRSYQSFERSLKPVSDDITGIYYREPLDRYDRDPSSFYIYEYNDSIYIYNPDIYYTMNEYGLPKKNRLYFNHQVSETPFRFHFFDKKVRFTRYTDYSTDTWEFDKIANNKTPYEQ